MAFRVGETGRYRTRIEEADTAHAFGNPGVRVLATPRLAEFCDLAAAEACRPAFEAGDASRRMRVDIRHLAATPPGDEVEVVARLVEVAGERLVFEISGRDSRREIVAGRVERRVV